MKYKKILSVLLLLGLTAPQLMFAHGLDGDNGNEKESKENKGFCTNLDKFFSNEDLRFGDKESEKNKKFLNKQSELETKRVNKDKELSDKRAEVLAKQDTRFEKMLAKASTTEQKKAVEDFRLAVKTAIETRQKAVDSAKNTYRTAIDKLFTERKAKTDQALATLKTSIDSAKTKAKTDCANGVDQNTVKDTFRQSVKTARDTFKNSVKDIVPNSDTIKQLNDARKQAFEKAHNDFKLALDAVVIVSGDGDFVPLVEYLKATTQVEVISFGKSTSGKLKEVADDFIDLCANPRKYLMQPRKRGGAIDKDIEEALDDTEEVGL
jgi:uncharacterized LabA/DUF88 family protein